MPIARPEKDLSFPAAERRGMRVCTAARDCGVFLRPLGDVIVMMPPLTLSDAEFAQLIDAVEYGIRVALRDSEQ